MLQNLMNLFLANYKALKWSHLLLMIVAIMLSSASYGQCSSRQSKSIAAGMGYSYNGGAVEGRSGLVYTFSYQNKIGRRDQLRFSPNFTFGTYKGAGGYKGRDEFYRVSSIGIDLNYDVVRIKHISLVSSVGVLGAYSRGLLGTGGYEPNFMGSEYFNRVYGAAKAAVAIRINKPTSRVAMELVPASLSLGPNHFNWTMAMFKLEYKLIGK